MTPAKVLCLLGKRMDDLHLKELPLARSAWMYANAHRDPGDEKANRPPAPFIELESFYLYSTKKGRSLVAKGRYVPGGIHNLKGAEAIRGDWEAWARSKRTVIRKKE